MRRTERLLAGERNPHDLSALFLWLRDRSFANKAVADVGDFVAHSESRDQGIAWRGVQHFFNAATFGLKRVRGARTPSSVEEFSAAAWSTFESYDPAEMRKQTGLGKNRAKKELARALEAVVAFDGETLLVHRALTYTENRIVKFFTSHLISKPAFTSSILLSQLLTCLYKNGLIHAPLSQVPQPFGSFVSLYALERMHMTRVLLENGKVTLLKALPDTGKLEVFAFMEVGIEPGPPSVVAFPIYQTDLDPSDWCDAELLVPIDQHGNRDWHFPLEIGPNGKLQKL